MNDDGSTKKRAWWEILAALTPLILGICVTGVGAFFTHVYNFRQLQLNQLAALEKFRPLLLSDNPYDREFAYASFAALGYEELAVKLVNLKQDAAGRSVVQEIKQTGGASAKAEASATLKSLPVQVYIHIADESQRPKAQSIREVLENKGYAVPGIENVQGKAEIPKNTNVRYFNDEDKDIAEGIVALLKEQGLTSAYPYRVSRFKVKPGSLEIWLSAKDMQA